MAQIELKKYGDKEYKVANDTWYDVRTSDEVIQKLEGFRQTKTRIRLRYGDTETGRDWMAEYDVEGTVGRSMGPVKIPLLIHNSRSMGGGVILDHCIVRLMTTGKNPVVYYSHPKYNRPEMALKTGTVAGLPFEVWVNGGAHARFETEAKAKAWLEKMTR